MYLLLYGGMLGGALATFLVVQAIGERGSITPVAVPPLPLRGGGGPDIILHVLLALAAVILVAHAVGALFRRFGQPPVIGEVIAGLLLGPSFLGHFAPGAAAFLLPKAIVPAMTLIAQIGVILYMFIVGLHLDTRQLKGQTHVSLAVSHASIVVPFSLGAILALALYPDLAPPGVGFTVFALFIAVSMSVTAFPVLARILTDSGLARSRLGTIALACASVDDVTAWCLLAFVVGVVESYGASIVATLALTGTYIGAMYFVVRPAARWLAGWRERRAELPPQLLPICFAALLVSAAVTEAIGIHALFGAFILGAIVPHDSTLARDLTERLEALVVVMLLPAFFVLTGMRTEIGLLGGASDWLICLAIIAVASLGKFGGSAAAARLTGLGWRDAAALGVLMNTRGLMELIVLNVGFDLGVISPRLFAMLVIMAVVTTVATAPILKALKIDRTA
jgi:Kef-type K+ transport system membrane component KefB